MIELAERVITRNDKSEFKEKLKEVLKEFGIVHPGRIIINVGENSGISKIEITSYL